jgi:hypothetical protein
MRKLLFALLLVTGAAQAEMYAVAPNQIGGHTVLSQKACPSNPKWKSAYAFSRNKDVAFACWYLEGNNVIFVTQSGTIRSMKLDSFEVVIENR